VRNINPNPSSATPMEEQLTVSVEKKLDTISRLVKCECIANTQHALDLAKGTICQIGDIAKKKFIPSSF